MLTNDAKKILYTLYSEYKARRSVGSSKLEASFFHDAHSIHQNFFSDWHFDDVEEALYELKNEDFLSGYSADNTLQNCALTNTAIATMENLPKDTLKGILEFIANFIP